MMYIFFFLPNLEMEDNPKDDRLQEHPDEKPNAADFADQRQFSLSELTRKNKRNKLTRLSSTSARSSIVQSQPDEGTPEEQDDITQTGEEKSENEKDSEEKSEPVEPAHENKSSQLVLVSTLTLVIGFLLGFLLRTRIHK